MENKQLFMEFIEGYINLFGELAELEKIQLEAIVKKDIAKADKCALELQTFIKRVEAAENKRLAVQKEAGFGDMKFSEIVEAVDDSEKEEYLRLFERFSRNVADVSFYSGKSQQQIEVDLKLTSDDSNAVYDASQTHKKTLSSSSSFEGKA